MASTSSSERSICFLTYRYLPETVGGPIFYTHRIAKHMAQRGWNVEVLARSHKHIPPQAIDRVAIQYNKTLRFRWGYFREAIDMSSTYPLSALPKLVTHLGKGTILHIMDSTLFFPLGAVAKLTKQAPIVASVVQDVTTSMKHGIAPRIASILNRTQTRLAVGMADRITAMSEKGYRYLIHKYPRQRHKIHLILGFLETDTFKPMPTHASTDVFRILVPQRLAWIKDIDTVLKAVAIARRHIQPFEIRITGQGPMLIHLLALTRALGLQRHVKFLGEMDHYRDMPQQYSSADLVLVPSLLEGGQPPQVVTEALAMRRPVAMSEACDTENVLRGACPMFPPRNPEELAKLVRHLRENPKLLDSIASKGHRLVKARYSIETFLKQHETLYEQLI